jgi:hypothetical protein
MTPTSTQWIDACIYIMDISMQIGAKLYPFLCGLGLLRAIASTI